MAIAEHRHTKYKPDKREAEVCEIFFKKYQYVSIYTRFTHCLTSKTPLHTFG